MLTQTLAALDADSTLDAGTAFARVIASYLERAHAGEGPVSTPRTPAELAARFDEPLPRAGSPLDEVLARVERDILADCNRLAHPMYLGHQVSAPLPAAVWTESLIGALNQSMAVWEMSPVATVLEHRVVRWMCDLAGFGPRAGGTLTSGGTEATFTALLAARAAAMPDAWEEGVGADPPVLICGEHAHYAVTRAAGELGLGMKRVVVIPSPRGKMDVNVLVRRLAELAKAGTRVMAVVATAGTTPTGSFDDLEAIGQLCESRGIWLHVDGAHGASALFSAKHRHRLRGIERARSIAWDPHKMMLLPLSAGMLLVRDERDLEAAFSQRAPYLFHAAERGEGEGERRWDQGTRSFQCSRRADVLKLWVSLQRYGAEGLGALYDHLCSTARLLYEELAAREEFEVLHEPECNILCFRWVGDGSMGPDRLDAINLELREAYNRSGQGWITTTVLGGRRVLRVTVMNPGSGHTYMARLVEGIVAEQGAAAGRLPG